MHVRLFVLSLASLLIAAGTVFGGGKKEEKLSVSFHLETEATDNPKMIFPQLANGKKRFFSRTPEISTKDLLSFTTFPSQDGADYGVVFRLKGSAANRFSAITTANQGRWMVAQINGRVIDGVLIDKTVNDGFIVIWKGVSLADVALLDEQMPRTGAEEKKKK
jgi:preprotein translocase subunit SecD